MAKGFLDGYKTYDTSEGFGNAKAWQGAFKQRMGKQEAEQVIRDSEQTPHGILGIAQSATKEEIKKAFRKLITEWHPDRNQHRITQAEERSKRIIAAYSLLTSK